MSDYSRSDKLLHHIALNFGAVRQAFFDLDAGMAKRDTSGVDVRAPVFVSGLARAGTTLLMRILHETGRFVAMSYRDMPFVLAPVMWARISRSHQKEGVQKERAHGDRLNVSFDSPEAFEEVFWLTFAGGSYIKSDRLIAHDVDPDVADRFSEYVRRILSRGARDRGLRYLSKNNNNVLRLSSIRRVFPDGRIIVPFRAPREQALSLLRQHVHFRELQANDTFALRYMSWLGHHEFGSDHRPFRWPGSSPLDAPTGGIEYWYAYWCDVYEKVLEQEHLDLIFFDYDAFCRDPQAELLRLATAIDVEPELLVRQAREVKAPTVYGGKEDLDSGLIARASQLHERLRERAQSHE
jgi:hypothetical protein